MCLQRGPPGEPGPPGPPGPPGVPGSDGIDVSVQPTRTGDGGVGGSGLRTMGRFVSFGVVKGCDQEVGAWTSSAPCCPQAARRVPQGVLVLCKPPQPAEPGRPSPLEAGDRGQGPAVARPLPCTATRYSPPVPPLALTPTLSPAHPGTSGDLSVGARPQNSQAHPCLFISCAFSPALDSAELTHCFPQHAEG